MSFGNAIERRRLQHVDAGVDRVAGDFVGLRLFQKPEDVARRVGFHQPVRAGILHRRQHDRRLRLALAVQRDDARQVDLREHVAVEHHQRVGDAFAGVAHAAGGAERRRLDDVAHLDADVTAVAEDFFDALGLVVQAEDDLVDFRHLLDEVELIVQKRPIENGDDRFRRVDGERAQARALASDQQKSLHVEAE